MTSKYWSQTIQSLGLDLSAAPDALLRLAERVMLLVASGQHRATLPPTATRRMSEAGLIVVEHIGQTRLARLTRLGMIAAYALHRTRLAYDSPEDMVLHHTARWPEIRRLLLDGGVTWTTHHYCDSEFRSALNHYRGEPGRATAREIREWQNYDLAIREDDVYSKYRNEVTRREAEEKETE